MNQQIFEQYTKQRSHVAMVLQYDRTFVDNPLTRKSDFFILVRDLSNYPHLQTLSTVGAILAIQTASLNEEEKSIQATIKELYSQKGASPVKWIKNSYVNPETSLVDMKMCIGLLLETFPIQLYIETSQTRKPLQTYVSGIHQLPQIMKDFVIQEVQGEETPIDDLLLKNIPTIHNVYCFTIYNCNEYINSMTKYRGDLLLGKEKIASIATLLHYYWTKIEKSELLLRLQSGAFSEGWIEEQTEIREDYAKLIRQESEYNELFWKVKQKDLFGEIGIYFNSFILENKDNKRERNMDLYSLFKFFPLTELVPFSRYSYGSQSSQKMVKIVEDFYRIEHIQYLEKWSTLNSYKDTPSNCVQWKGFSNGVEYEVILFQDATYQIRFYHQRVHLDGVEALLEQIRQVVLLPVQSILQSIGVSIQVPVLQLGKNIYFVFSKLEIHVSLKQELEVGKLQNVINKSNFLFDREGGLISNEFVNVEFKKVNNYTRSDQIFKYINYYVTQNRVTELSEIGPVIKQIMTKYSKNVLDATELVQGWIRRFVDVTSQHNKKIKISKNIGLDVIGKQLGSNLCTFYMSNVVNLDDIYTFYYYLTILIQWSQNTENNRIYSELVGKKVDEKMLQKIQGKKDEEGEVDVLGDIDFDALEFDDAEQVVDDDLLDRMSVHSEEEADEAAEAEAVDADDHKADLPDEEDVFDELEPLVNGSSYYIKRLQTMDKEIYDYKIDERFKPYSKKAMPNDSRQPIVLSTRQMKKIRDRYKDDTNVYGGIKPELALYKDYKKPSYSLEYRNLHYICPKVWCMRDQLPYYMTDLVGAKIGENEKGEYLLNPADVRCPDCGEGIWNHNLGTGTLLIAQDNLKRQPYPGFFTGDQHPKGNCMVACFKRPDQKIKECANGAKDQDKGKKQSNQKYILKGDKYGKCNYGRYCVLPNLLHEWMNQDFGDKKNERTIINKYIGFLRKGVLQEDEMYYQSFEKTLQFLLGESIFPKSSSEFREYLIQTLKTVPEIKKIFRRCRKGSLYLYFGKDIENFYTYLQQTISLQPKFLLPILSYPGILLERGVNFFMLQEDGGKIFFDCEYFDYEYNESRMNAQNMFLYRYSMGNSYKKIYYEPVVQVQEQSKKALEITTFGTGKGSIMEDLFRYIKKECAQTEDPLVVSAKLQHISEEEYFIPKPSTQKVIQSIMSSSDIQPLYQYVNSYNQTEGFIVYQKKDGKNYYIPVVPMQIIEDINIVKQKTQVPLQSFDDTISFLEELSKSTSLPYRPYFYTMHRDGNLRTGLFTVTGLWVPIINDDAKEVGTLKRWGTPKDIWIQEPMQGDERTVDQKQRDMKSLNYEKLRFELSRLINSANGMKQMILDNMRAYKEAPTIVEKEKIRMQFITELSGFIRNEIVTPGLIGDWNKTDLFNYCSNHTELEQCNTSSMCRWSGSCKMIVQPEWYWKFVSRMVEELLVNVNKRKEMVEEYRKELDLPENEQIFYSKDELDEYIGRYDFNVENKKFMKHPLEHFDYTNPKPILTDTEVEKVETYVLPNYIKRLFETSSANSRISYGDRLGIMNSTDQSSNYFFRSMDDVQKKYKTVFLPTRQTLAKLITKYSEPAELLDKYQSLYEQEYGEIYRKFLAMKSIPELSEYVKTNSWGSEIDLELLSYQLGKEKKRIIIINDVGHIDRHEPFIYLPNQLQGLVAEEIDQYQFIIFSKYKNRFNLLMKRDTKSPLFISSEIPFLAVWLQGQARFESQL